MPLSLFSPSGTPIMCMLEYLITSHWSLMLFVFKFPSVLQIDHFDWPVFKFAGCANFHCTFQLQNSHFLFIIIHGCLYVFGTYFLQMTLTLCVADPMSGFPQRQFLLTAFIFLSIPAILSCFFMCTEIFSW